MTDWKPVGGIEMREIKFRAWHKERKEMFWWDIMWGNHYSSGSGYIGMVPFGEARKYYGLSGENREEIDPNNCEIMQYTGLKDKNGKEIYEGDIVIWYVNNQKVTAPIIFEDGMFFMGKAIDKSYGLVCNDWLRGEYEAIGNIYENPELLEAKHVES